MDNDDERAEMDLLRAMCSRLRAQLTTKGGRMETRYAINVDVPSVFCRLCFVTIVPRSGADHDVANAIADHERQNPHKHERGQS